MLTDPRDVARYFDPAQPIPATEGSELFRPGVVFGLPDGAYREFYGLSSSLLKEQTAAEMWHALTTPRDSDFETESRAMAFTVGQIVHWAVLEPWKFRDPWEHVVLSPTKGLATERAKGLRTETDKLLVTPELVDLGHQCVEAMMVHPDVRALLSWPAGREVSLFYFDTSVGVWRKARFDFLPTSRSFLLDVKTTGAPLPQFPWEARKFGYHIQAAWYLDIWEALTGERREEYFLIAVNKEAPFMAKVFRYLNPPKNHVLYGDRHPLRQAREILAAREATFVTACGETLAALQPGESLTPALTRQLWPAYEGDAQGGTPIISAY